MRCRKCDREAVIKLRSHHTAFCEEHFIEFFERRVNRTIRKYRMFRRDERIMVAVSGGKDSLTLLYLLHKMGYDVTGYHIRLGIGDYSRVSYEKIKKLSESYGIDVIFEDVKDVIGSSIEELRGRFRNVCSVCGTVKRYMINRIAKNFDVVATGHNLDDESSRLLGNLLHWHEGYILRHSPVLKEENGFKRKVKPFLYNSEFEIAAYAYLSGIDYVYRACPFSKTATTRFYKKVLNSIEYEMPGTKMMFLQGFYEFKRKFKLEEEKVVLRRCVRCGEPSYNEVCSVCRLKERLGITQE